MSIDLKRWIQAEKQRHEEVLTLAQAADFYAVSERTMWTEAKEGNVPSFRVGKQYRFLKSDLVAHAKQQLTERI